MFSDIAMMNEEAGRAAMFRLAMAIGAMAQSDNDGATRLADQLLEAVVADAEAQLHDRPSVRAIAAQHFGVTGEDAQVA